ncbi:DUF4238 domain-containing protein [Brevundimonas diminuta]|uniref:DUF4238 domain-containing protein n=1 Tax=Brevundimonas diminuta TaxID=293 RepID=A0A1Z3LVL9_BREDI|nr:DUF4238 domain-containing protein [Brevundimonas diminuta]ASD26262.1 hypothetical protein CD943_04760 [Brevundimonas diminuta]
MAESKKHHFVAQSILRRFTNAAADDRLYVYDKARDVSHPSTVLAAGMENGFNVVHIDGERINFEGDFDQPDGAMANVQNRLVDARSLAVLSDADRLVLADTAAVQLLRTKMFRSTMRSVTDAIFSDMERVGLLAGERPELGEQDARAMARAALHERERQRDLLAKLDQILIEPEPGGSFWTSDNPLVRYNQQPYGETGLASPGVEVYWPIASDLAVGFMCPTFSKRIDQGVELGDALEKPVRDQCLAIQTALAAGTPTTLGRGRTDAFLNELQVRSSSRFIYSRDDDFTLARSILAKSPALKKVDSMVAVGRIGEGPGPRANMPKGLQLVVYGRDDHLMVPLVSYTDAGGGFDALFEEPAYANMLMSQLPWKEVRIFDDGAERRGMRQLKVTFGKEGKLQRVSVRNLIVLPGLDD